jgi:hypothetical protein
MLSAMRSLSMVKRMIMITGTGDHDRPEWLIIITGIRRLDLAALRTARHRICHRATHPRCACRLLG